MHYLNVRIEIVCKIKNSFYNIKLYLISIWSVTGCLTAIDSVVLNSKIDEYRKSSSWANQQLEADLGVFKKSDFDNKQIEIVRERSLDLACIHIHGRSVHLQPSKTRSLNEREEVVLRSFRDLASLVDLPDLSLLICAQDSLPTESNLIEQYGQVLPICAFAKESGQPGLLIPDSDILRGYAGLRKMILDAEAHAGWETKISKAIWRGSTTGGTFEPHRWQHFPRSQLVLAALRYPEWIDAKFTRVVQSSQPERMKRELQKKRLWARPISEVQMCRYRYLIDVDGNSCGYSRMYWGLLSSSCVMKIASSNIQWYYDLLIPYKNFVPINGDLSNFEDVFSWLEAYPEQAKAIACNATQLAEEELSFEACLAYLAVLCEKISLKNRVSR